MNWYLLGKDGQTHGPYTKQQLREWVTSGQISGKVKIRRQDSQRWMVARLALGLGRPPSDKATEPFPPPPPPPRQDSPPTEPVFADEEGKKGYYSSVLKETWGEAISGGLLPFVMGGFRNALKLAWGFAVKPKDALRTLESNDSPKGIISACIALFAVSYWLADKIVLRVTDHYFGKWIDQIFLTLKQQTLTYEAMELMVLPFFKSTNEMSSEFALYEVTLFFSLLTMILTVANLIKKNRAQDFIGSPTRYIYPTIAFGMCVGFWTIVFITITNVLMLCSSWHGTENSILSGLLPFYWVLFAVFLVRAIVAFSSWCKWTGSLLGISGWRVFGNYLKWMIVVEVAFLVLWEVVMKWPLEAIDSMLQG